MKIISLIVFGFLSFFQFAQQSIIFKNPLPTKEGIVQTVDRNYLGTYRSSDEMINYIFDENGISIFSTTISSISKELIRETGKYDVRNGYLFGVIENDSVPCVLENDRYYFGLRNKQTIIGEGSENKLSKINKSEYLLNIYEGGNFIPTLIKFTSSGCEISYFDYDEEDLFFSDIKEKKDIKGEYFNILLLDPDVKETQQLLQQSIFTDKQKFSKL